MLMAMDDFLRRGGVTGALLETDSDRHAAESLLDYWTTILYRAGIEPPDASLREFDPDLTPDLEDALCPYLGLEVFRESDSSRFFGFEPFLADCLLRLSKSRVLAIVGSPGSGKSSFVQAALLPALKSGILNASQNWHYYPPITPGSDPLVSLVRLIQPPGDVDAECTESQVERFREDTSLLARCVAGSDDEPAVIVVDQFEEVFTLCDDASSRMAFVNNVLNLNQVPDRRHAVILTMRSDFRSHVARLAELLRLFQQAQIHVTPLDASSLREAIVRPAQLVGLKFHDGLVEALVKELVGEPKALPLLQFTMMQLWENRSHDRITWKAFRQFGSGRQALARGADAFYESLTPEEQQTSKRILLRMIHVGEGMNFVSSRVRRRSLYRASESQDSIDQVLAKLINARIVRLTHGDSAVDAQVELAHEALVSNWPRLVEWLENQRIATTQRLRLSAAAEQWRETGREPGALWGGALLDEALRHQDLTELETEFVQASRLAADARVRSIEALSAMRAAELQLVEAERLGEKSEPNARSMEAPPRRYTLLVVDDEREVVESLHNLFRKSYQVLTATSGDQAIQLLLQHNVHLIMSDQRMPGMPGDAFLSRARRLQPDAIRILFTGYADIQAVINAVNDGQIFRYVLKPWDTNELVEIVRQAAEWYDLGEERKRLIALLQAANTQLVNRNNELARAGQLKTAFIEVVSQELHADFRRPVAENTPGDQAQPERHRA
jgi:CheY-like chemotaxis protein